MSKVGQPNGDDHADAAQRNLVDAAVLLAGSRPDGAAYLSGYVVECSLKTLWLIEVGVPPGGASWSSGRGHDLRYLAAQVASLTIMAGARTAKYLGSATRAVASASIAAWTPAQRYRGSHMRPTLAKQWYEEAEAVYNETVGAMYLDGVL